VTEPSRDELEAALSSARALGNRGMAREQIQDSWRRLRATRPRSLAELARERLAVTEERRQLAQARCGRDVAWAHGDGESQPLVTIRIATYNRGALVAERAIWSALRQTYGNLEVLVVGDACDDATQEAVLAVDDPRVRFVNLPSRGLYPAEPMHRWMVAGAHPMNAALYLARGAWIAPCDDDDALTDDHVERLLEKALADRLEMVWSRAAFRDDKGSWFVTAGPPLRHGQISHGSVLYSSALRFVRHSESCWRIPEPADWNMWRRMRVLGVRIGFLDHLTYLHY
jgi:hypothetical protein